MIYAKNGIIDNKKENFQLLNGKVINNEKKE